MNPNSIKLCVNETALPIWAPELSEIHPLYRVLLTAVLGTPTAHCAARREWQTYMECRSGSGSSNIYYIECVAGARTDATMIHDRGESSLPVAAG